MNLQMWLLVIGTVLVFAVAILVIARILYITDPSKVTRNTEPSIFFLHKYYVGGP